MDWTRNLSAAPSFAGFDPFAASLPAASTTSASAIQGLEQLFETLAQRILALEIDLSTRPSLEGKEKNVRFGSLNVSTIQDTEAWINLKPDAMKWGYLLDVYTICLLFEKLVNGERDYYKKMQTVQKIELGSPREAEALVALSAPVPSLFTDSGKGMFGKKDSAFSQFPTFASFKAQTDRINRAITTVGSGVNNQIDMNVPTGSHIHRLLKLAVSLSCAFIQKYITWLTQSTEESLAAGLGAGPSWCLSLD